MRTLTKVLTSLLAAGLAVACSTAAPRSGFETDVNGTTPADGGTPSPTFSTKGTGQASGDGGGGCSQSQPTVTRTPVVIEFVLDESSSMNDDDKWAAATSALQAAFDDMHTSADPATFIGFLRFSDSVDHQVAPLPLTSDANDAQYQALTNAISDGPNGDTFTFDAMTAAYGVVDQFNPPVSAGTDIRRIVVLMTDGEPSGGASEQAQCTAAASQQLALPAGPVETFAVGIGPFPTGWADDYDPVFMGNLAVAGGTAPPNCDPASKTLSSICHFQVTPGGDVASTKQQLLDAIDKIRALSASCDYGFSVTGDANLSDVSVTITQTDGTVQSVPKDATNGWTFDSDTQPKNVLLHGAACSASSGTVSGRVDITVGCRSAQ